MPPTVVKIGMLYERGIISSVADFLKRYAHSFKAVVLDPVMFAKSGDCLLKKEAVIGLQEDLLPWVTLITPNLPEAEALCNVSIRSFHQMETAARWLRARYGLEAVVIKGGHLDEAVSADFFLGRDCSFWLRHERISTRNDHGTGCCFSAAIAALLAKGYPMDQALVGAKEYLTDAMRAGAKYHIGRGHGPLHHFYRYWK